jgi:hypothetical protein
MLDPFIDNFIREVILRDRSLYGPMDLGGPGMTLSYMNDQYQKKLNTDQTIPISQEGINWIYKQMNLSLPTEQEKNISTALRLEAGM